MAAMIVNGDIRGTISTTEIMNAVKWCTEDSNGDVQFAAVRVVVALGNHDIMRAAVVTPELCRRMAGKVEGYSEFAKEFFAAMIIHNDTRAMISVGDTIDLLKRLMGYSGVDARQAAVGVILALRKHEDTRAAVLTGLSRYTLESLKDERSDVRENTLGSISSVVADDDIQLTITTPAIIDQINELLGDPTDTVQRAAADVLISLANHDDTRAVATTDLGQTFAGLLKSRTAARRESVLELMNIMTAHSKMPLSEAPVVLEPALGHIIISLGKDEKTRDVIAKPILGHNILGLFQYPSGGMGWYQQREALDSMMSSASPLQHPQQYMNSQDSLETAISLFATQHLII
ncbi:armadillo-type protein [Mycena galopus ATCC 62051]|nr:armadillo-type protein [Mycena galopus ATCC 62051]